MIITREWAMPNSNTFSIKPINAFISSILKEYSGGIIIDPFARNTPFKAGMITNDLDPTCDTDYHMDALDFLKRFEDNSVDMVLFDPPYSPRQVSECYRQLNQTVNMQTTQASFWSNMKAEIGRIVRPEGGCITFGWNSGGVGQKYGFSIVQILLVAHGGWHNDTICTMEKKVL